ncbi:MAG TPA: medium chain dehydrogenase/reductase family protein [Solirubrobacterales bacterium]|nr:medium chain dehydrogenase/reductase family protein [Solirubrobacterales bacterium]
MDRHGGPEVLRVAHRERPAPDRGEVRIAVAAAGVNFADLMARMGIYPPAPRPPFVLGYEVAGAVEAVGDGVDTAWIGRRVAANTPFGGYAEEVVVPVAALIRLPDRTSFQEGAAVPVSYATAWAALVDYGNLQPGQRVLIHSAAGGVGLAATQIAKRRGAEIWGTASPAKHGAIEAAGIDHPIDSSRRSWEGLPPLDLVMDPVGGRSWRRSYRLLRPGGRLVVYGMSSMVSGERRRLRSVARVLVGAPRFPALRQMADSIAVIGLNLHTLWEDRGTLAPWTAPLGELLAEGAIAPMVAAERGFSAASDAHRLLLERRNVGKVVLVPEPE